MKTWAIQLTYHLTEDDDDFDPREWDTKALLKEASEPYTPKQWRFTELIQGETTIAHDALIKVENNTATIFLEPDPDTQP